MVSGCLWGVSWAGSGAVERRGPGQRPPLAPACLNHVLTQPEASGATTPLTRPTDPTPPHPTQTHREDDDPFQ